MWTLDDMPQKKSPRSSGPLGLESGPIMTKENPKPKYILKYWFEHGGICLWSVNENAKERFDYPIENHILPISEELVEELDNLEVEYKGYLNWNDPLAPSPWTPKQKNDFRTKANETFDKLIIELGSDFEVINKIDDCVS
jgi:hypothetical protein